MSGERLDYSIERQRHAGFVGRKALLARLGSKANAEALFDRLQPDVRVFLDSRSLQPGDHWHRQIPAAQRASRATVILISVLADAAWYLSDEIVSAIALHRAAPTEHLLVPVLLEPGLKLPYGLAAIQAIDATTAGGLDGVAAQLRAVVAPLRGE
jgi:TIR domain